MYSGNGFKAFVGHNQLVEIRFTFDFEKPAARLVLTVMSFDIYEIERSDFIFQVVKAIKITVRYLYLNLKQISSLPR